MTLFLLPESRGLICSRIVAQLAVKPSSLAKQIRDMIILWAVLWIYI